MLTQLEWSNANRVLPAPRLRPTAASPSRTASAAAPAAPAASGLAPAWIAPRGHSVPLPSTLRVCHAPPTPSATRPRCRRARRAHPARLAPSAPCSRQLACAATRQWRAATAWQESLSVPVHAGRRSRGPGARRVRWAHTQGWLDRRRVTHVQSERPQITWAPPTRVSAFVHATLCFMRRVRPVYATPGLRVTLTHLMDSARRAPSQSTRKLPAPACVARVQLAPPPPPWVPERPPRACAPLVPT
mmetsp:Transcript_32057/g.80619  ORF Transcript_32057/g.80619 Transcript_32057/m.80619 type:complete len:245 (+) Transcript_32057:2336-3070(+)